MELFSLKKLGSLPFIIGHRGHAGLAPENTIVSLESAVLAGASMIEVDIHPTKDGKAVVIHDDTLNRTTNGHGTVASHTLSELVTLDAGSWFSPAYRNIQIPALDDLIAFMLAHPHIGLVAEFKGEWGSKPLEDVISAFANYDLISRILTHSFDLATISLLSKTAPLLAGGIGWETSPEGLISSCISLGAVACFPDMKLLESNPALVPSLHAEGIAVFPWTLNDANQWNIAFSYGVEGIITNYAGRLAGWMDSKR